MSGNDPGVRVRTQETVWPVRNQSELIETQGRISAAARR